MPRSHHRILAILALSAAALFAPPGVADAQDWVEVTPASGPMPTPRRLAGAVYDPIAHAMVVFAGEDAGGRVNDVWALDLGAYTWTELTPSSGAAPAGRITPAAVYDGDNHQMLTFAGQGAGGTFFNDTWAFDLTAHTWSQFSPPGATPAIRYGVATCYDVVAKTQVIFAGFTFQGRFDDTWRFDPSSGGWTDVSPVAGSPLERCLHVACFDAMGRKMIMYGGQNAGPLGDIWSFDLATETWTEVTPTSGPDPRYFSTLEYDSINHRATMFSGNRGSLGLSNDAWVFDLYTNQWLQLSPSGTPPVARDGAAAVYVASEDRLVVFGGSSASNRLNDVWSLGNLSDTPTGVSNATPPGHAVLLQNYPNPFNPGTVIRYRLNQAGRASLRVYDATGALVRVLVEGVVGGGEQRVVWSGDNQGGERVASGVYFYRLIADGIDETRKTVLLK